MAERYELISLTPAALRLCMTFKPRSSLALISFTRARI